MDCENHWLNRDRTWQAEMSNPEPSEPELPSWHELEWEKGECLDYDPEERQADCLVTCEFNGREYEGIGTYSCGDLVDVTDIELKHS